MPVSRHRDSIPFSEFSEDTRGALQRRLYSNDDYEDRDGHSPNDSCEDLEESQVLEDVFFIR